VCTRPVKRGACGAFGEALCAPTREGQRNAVDTLVNVVFSVVPMALNGEHDGDRNPSGDHRIFDRGRGGLVLGKACPQLSHDWPLRRLSGNR
jgi:hypothetical protein